MSNDYFKAQGWFKNYALNSEDSRGMFQRLVKEDEKVFRLASAETDRIKNMINKKYGPGTMKYGSETPQPPERPDVIEIDAINAFMKRNPAAEGGQMVKPSDDGSRPGYAGDRDKTTKIKNFIGKKKKIKKTEIIKLLNDLEYPNWSTQLAKLKKRGYFDNVEIIDDFKQTRATLEGGGSRISQVEDIFKNWKSTGKTNYTKQELIEALPEGAYEKNKAAYDTAENTIKKNYKSIKLIEQNIDRSKPLPKSVQQKLVEAFPEIDFKFGTKAQPGYGIRKYGVIKKDVGEALYSEIQAFAKYNLEPQFPKGTTPESKLLYSMFRSTQPGSGGGIRFQLVDKNGKVIPKEKYPQNWRKDGAYKNIRILDTKTGDIIKYTDDIKGKGISMKEYINKVEKNPQAYDQALESYKLQKNISTTPYMYKGKEYTLGGTLNKNRVIENFKKEFGKFPTKNEMKDLFKSNNVGSWQVHHPEGVANNWWKSEVAFRDANMKLNYLDRNLKASLKTVDNPKDKAKLIKQVSTEVKKLPGGISYIFEGQELGKPLNLKSVIRAPISQANLKAGEKKAIEKAIQEIEAYITDTTGKVKQPMLSSGFSGAYEMLSDDLKKIINSEGFKTFKAKIANPALKTAVGAAKLPTKIFGAADLVLGYLDYTNNRQKGFSKEDSTRHMVDAVLFGATSFGEKGDIEGVKKIAMQNGMSEEVFNNLVSVNLNQKAMIDRINESKAKFNESMDIIESKTADPVTEKMLIQKLKVDTKKFLTNTMKDIVDASRSLNTNLQVQEAGAPININVDTQQQKAFSDLGSASREFVQKRIDESDPKVFEQGDTTMGKIGSAIKETVMQPDFYTGFFKKTKAQKDREDMEKLKIQDPTLYYKMLMSEGVDPRIKLNIPVQLEFEQKYPEFGTQLSDSLTQNKAEGGITTLRSKYEYKK
jgi:hypothetical protein